MRGGSCLSAAALAWLFALPSVAADLVPHGVYHWSEDSEGFGGFSGLSIGEGGAEMLAVTDRGLMMKARIMRDSGGRIVRIEPEWQSQMRDNNGREVAGFTSDAEALAVGADGTAYVGFESYTRVTALTPPDMTPRPLHAFDRFKAFWGNAGFESLALHSDGRLLAILEGETDGARRVFTYTGGAWADGPALPGSDGYALTDATFGDDGLIYLLERRLALSAGYATRLTRRSFSDDVFGPEEVLLETAPGVLDNMEGVSLWRDAEGRRFLALISDDNFLPFQNTIIAEYLLEE